tara:strand:+ start:2743 stop:3153 length:411 start_codon:yes stop_codon:yes gene_type:complete
LKRKYLISFFILLISFNIASDFKTDIKIKSESVEFLKDSNKVYFLNTVEVSSEYVNIKSDSAIYDETKNVITFSGNPSFIKSKKEESLFDGKADKILFFTDEKVHLKGNATMKYENISISSNLIIFNPQTGKMSSE